MGFSVFSWFLKSSSAIYRLSRGWVEVFYCFFYRCLAAAGDERGLGRWRRRGRPFCNVGGVGGGGLIDADRPLTSRRPTMSVMTPLMNAFRRSAFIKIKRRFCGTQSSLFPRSPCWFFNCFLQFLDFSFFLVLLYRFSIGPGTPNLDVCRHFSRFGAFFIDSFL